MSFTETKEQIAQLTPAERLEIAALITHLSQASGPNYRTELDRQLAEMDAGRKFSRQDLEQVHGELSRQGR